MQPCAQVGGEALQRPLHGVGHGVAHALLEHEVDPALQLLQHALGDAALQHAPFLAGPAFVGAAFQLFGDRLRGRGRRGRDRFGHDFGQYRDAGVEWGVLAHDCPATKWVRGWFCFL